MPRPFQILWHAFNELHRSSSKAILRALEEDRDKQVTMQRTEWRGWEKLESPVGAENEREKRIGENAWESV